MTLSLITLRCPDQVTPETRRVQGGEFSLGRGGDNDWVLVDPDRELSKRHCVLAYRSGTWTLADHSTNGTFLNWDTDPLGHDRPRPLRDGDRLRLGRYEIEVRIDSAVDHLPLPDPFGDALRMHKEPAMGDVSIGLTLDANSFGADASPFLGPVQPDHTPSVGDAYRPPAVQSDGLPDDWDADPATPESGAAVAAPRVAPPFAEAPPTIPPCADPVPVAPPSAGTDDLLGAFLRGAGLPQARPVEPVATMEALGTAFRVMVNGLRQALIARAAIKGEFRVEQTRIRARGNNPLKFSADDDDALLALLGAGRPTDMTAAAAVGEALRDMRLHEVATTAAMQSAVRALLAQLDPVQIQQTAGAGGLATVPSVRKTRWWDAYEALHTRTTEALSDDFDSVFGKAFARAYEQALLELSQRETPA